MKEATCGMESQRMKGGIMSSDQFLFVVSSQWPYLEAHSARKRCPEL